jgi:hypothetical protein
MARATKKPAKAATAAGLPPGDLRRHSWPMVLWGPDPELLEKLYVPALGEAQRYDRCCAYFSSSVLAAAARGFGRLIERLLALGPEAPRPAVRLIVNEELNRDDVRALLETGDTSQMETQLKKRFKPPRELLEKQRLGMLGWLVKAGFLEVRVGVMRFGTGIVHAKFGMATDAADQAVVFSGSGNESAQGLLANFECLDITTSWENPERYREYVQKFEALWADRDAAVHTVSLPEALRLELIKFAPPEPPIMEPAQALARQKAAMVWGFLVEAPFFPDGGPNCDATAMVEQWPHQRRVVAEASRAWPAGRLLCDEVGLGKTIEAILVLRRLLAGRGLRRALILVPAGLLKQWQGELREKGGLLVPRLESINSLVWPDGQSKKINGLAVALKQDVLLMSRETARAEDHRATILQSEPWDLVLLDEAHAARRGKQEEGEYNSSTLLLRLLRELQLRRRARGFLLLSATPMQTHPWEPWDLLAILGEGGAWLADFGGVRDYYAAMAAIRQGHGDLEMAREAATLIAVDPEFPAFPRENLNLSDIKGVVRKLTFLPPRQRSEVVNWLRQGSPLTRRMHRNTRKTLRGYYEIGLLTETPPRRRVEDLVFDFQDQAERAVYEAIGRYIEKRYQQLESEKPGKGFVMTVYRRRAISSPLALERSLNKRGKALRRIAEDKAFDWYLSPDDVPEALEQDDLPEGEGAGKISLELPTDRDKARAELREVDHLLGKLQRLSKDSKLERFFEVLRQLSAEGRSVLVFTEYLDTLEYLRDNLVPYYGKSLGCFSGEGGQTYDGKLWRPVSKAEITTALHGEEIRILLCTDAASEGLNLQAANAIINYDLPWNPSKVEQRIGRIDRIGQKLPEVLVVNLFLKDSVDDKVYRALRRRCGLFEHFVGSMQPVLARARRMLLGQEEATVKELDKEAGKVEDDPLATETYVENPPEVAEEGAPGITTAHLEEALAHFQGDFGPKIRFRKHPKTYEIGGHGNRKFLYGASMEALERNQHLRPLSPFDSEIRNLAVKLWRPGERLPLVLGCYQEGPFRVAIAYWIGGKQIGPVTTLEELKHKVAAWDGNYPDAELWQRAGKKANQAAKKYVRAMAVHASGCQEKGMRRQVGAARLRLMRELGRMLMCLEGSEVDLNQALQAQISRETATAFRLKQCLERLGGYPDWTPELRRDLKEFFDGLHENQRKARCLGRELDAALQDPRWEAKA